MSKDECLKLNSPSKLNILITGNRGYIGSALHRYLVDQYLVKQAIVGKVVGYDIVDGDDIMDIDRLVSVMKREQITIVIHLAALSSVTACTEQPILATKINGTGTRNILQAMAAADCYNIIYASTSSVYGNRADLPYKETDLPAPCSAYGSSKLLGESAIQDHFEQHGGNYLIYRMFNVVGTSGYPDIDNSVHPGYDRLFGALQSGKVTIYGDDYATRDGSCERDYISLKDVCAAYLAGIVQLTTKVDLRSVVNICTQCPTTVKQIISAWNECHHKMATTNCESLHKATTHELSPKITPLIGERRVGDPAIVYGSNIRAQQVLRWSPSLKIDDIIRDIVIDKKI